MAVFPALFTINHYTMFAVHHITSHSSLSVVFVQPLSVIDHRLSTIAISIVAKKKGFFLSPASRKKVT